MEPITELYKLLDEKDWDIRDEQLINQEFQKFNDKLFEAKETSLLQKSEIERQAVAFGKYPKKVTIEKNGKSIIEIIGLHSKMSGTRKLEDGSEIPFEWPNIKEWKEDDFDHIKQRYKQVKNTYLKSEYGLVLYYSGNLIKDNEVKTLLEILFKLAQIYFNKAKQNEVKNHYILFFRSVLTNIFHIASKRQHYFDINEFTKQLITYVTDIHNNWDVKMHGTQRAIIDITDFTIEYFNLFKEIDLKVYLDKNFEAAKEIAKTYHWGAIYISDISIKLAKKLKDTRIDWETFKAEQYEAMVDSNIETGNLAAVSFVESALTIYKKLKNKTKIEELSKKYQEIRKIFRLNEMATKLPEDESERLISIVKKEVADKEPKEILGLFALRPMYASVEKIIEMSNDQYSKQSFSKLFPTSILDKYGNTVEIFLTEEEKKKFVFWQTYGVDFQIGTQTFLNLFFEAYNANKISYESVIEFLSNSWLGKSYHEMFNGYEYDITPLNAIEPGIKSFFEEMSKWKEDERYIPNFICATDSLVSKAEYIIRFFCKLIDIPTFTDKIKNSHKVKNEKNIDELIRSLENTTENTTGFLEDHRKLIEFVLASKMGSNLRHKVAHGLMDPQEYVINHPLIMISIYIVLSQYTFK